MGSLERKVVHILMNPVQTHRSVEIRELNQSMLPDSEPRQVRVPILPVILLVVRRLEFHIFFFFYLFCVCVCVCGNPNPIRAASSQKKKKNGVSKFLHAAFCSFYDFFI